MGLFSCCSKKPKAARPGEMPAEPKLPESEVSSIAGTIGSINGNISPISTIESVPDSPVYRSLSIKAPKPGIEIPVKTHTPAIVGSDSESLPLSYYISSVSSDEMSVTIESDGSITNDDMISPSNQRTPIPDDKTIISPLSNDGIIELHRQQTPDYDGDNEGGIEIEEGLEIMDFSPASSGAAMAPPSIIRTSPIESPITSPVGDIAPSPMAEEGG